MKKIIASILCTVLVLGSINVTMFASAKSQNYKVESTTQFKELE